MNSKKRKELYSEKVVAGSRTYFFDVKEADDGTKYLVISESKRMGSSYNHARVMIFEEHLEAFAEGFQKALQFLGVCDRAHAEAPRQSVATSVESSSEKLDFPDPREASPARVRAALHKIIEVEGPLTKRHLFRLYVNGCPTLWRADRSVKRSLNSVLYSMQRAGEIILEDELGDRSPESQVIRLAGAPVVRERRTSGRDLLEIPASELFRLFDQIIDSTAPGVPEQEDLMRSLLDYYGFSKLTWHHRRHLEKVLRAYDRTVHTRRADAFATREAKREEAPAATEHQSVGERTPEEAYRLPILRALVAMGGKGKVSEILDEVYREVKHRLTPFDLQPLPSGGNTLRWRNAARWERKHMVMAGLLRDDSPHGVWEITEMGREWLDDHGA